MTSSERLLPPGWLHFDDGYADTGEGFIVDAGMIDAVISPSGDGEDHDTIIVVRGQRLYTREPYADVVRRVSGALVE